MLGLTIALMAIFAVPAPAAAATLTYRNDSGVPIIVQGLGIVNGVLRQGKRHVLQPGDIARDPILAPGNKLIVISDAKQPTRTLYQDTIPVNGGNLFFSIQSDDPPPKKGAGAARAPKITKVKLVPVQIPVGQQGALAPPNPRPTPSPNPMAVPPASPTPNPRRPPG